MIILLLGRNLKLRGEEPQTAVPAGCCFGNMLHKTYERDHVRFV